MREITFKEAQNQVDALVQKLGGYWPPFSMLASITEEVGELAREINALEKIKIKKASEPQKEIGQELADTIFSLICMANYYNIDLEKEFNQMMEKNATRDKDRFNNFTS